MLKLHIHNDSVNSLHDPMRNHEDCAAADLLLASTPEERTSVVDTLMWNLVQPPHEIPATTDDRHVRYKPEDAISLQGFCFPSYVSASLSWSQWLWSRSPGAAAQQRQHGATAQAPLPSSANTAAAATAVSATGITDEFTAQ